MINLPNSLRYPDMINLPDPGSARVSRAGFGVPPKQSFLETTPQEKFAKARTPSPTREMRGLPGFARHAKQHGHISLAYDRPS